LTLSEALENFGITTRRDRPVRVAIVDSGVYAAHSHVQRVAGGVSIIRGHPSEDYVDRHGHGTAVAAAVREKAPGADLFAVKIFDRTLAATAGLLVDAMEWAARNGIDIINLSLGTTNVAHSDLLQTSVRVARHAGAVVVAAADQAGVPSLPGSLEGVVSVSLDWGCPRDETIVDAASLEAIRVRASGFPRPIKGVPPDRNLRGISFAVANVSGLIAREMVKKV
jgi:subtilisin family serine protease